MHKFVACVSHENFKTLAPLIGYKNLRELRLARMEQVDGRRTDPN